MLLFFWQGCCHVAPLQEVTSQGWLLKLAIEYIGYTGDTWKTKLKKHSTKND